MSAQTAEFIYAMQREGWNTIPLERPNKVPVLHDGRGNKFPLSDYFERMMSEDEVRQWTNLPNADNVGVVLGATSNNLIVVDVDDVSKVEKYRSQHPTRMVRTPSGGVHLYYYNTTGQFLPNGRLEPGIEVFTNNHYAMLPPSFVQAERSGRQYSGEYEWLNNMPIAAFPVTYIAQLLSGYSPESPRTGKYNQEEIRQLVNHVIMHGSFIEGSHNDTLFHGTLLLASRGWPLEEIEAIFIAADNRDDSPQGEAVVRSAVARAFKVHEDRKSQYDRQRDTGVRSGSAGILEQSADVLGRDVSPRRLETLNYAEFGGMYGDYEVNWLIEDWITEQAVIMMAAPPGNYKSWVSYEMAICLALGLPFQGEKEVKGPAPVLLVQQEDPMFSLYERLYIIERGKLALYGDRFEIEFMEDEQAIYYYSQWATLLTSNLHIYPDADIRLTEESMTALQNKIAELRPSLVVIDPFYSLDDSSEYFKEAGDKIRTLLKPIRNRYGCAFLLIHHTRKANTGQATGDKIPPPTRDSVFGSQLMNAATEGIILLYRPRPSSPTTVGVVRFFKNAPANEHIWFDMRIDARASDGKPAYESVIVPANGMSELEAQVVQILVDEGPLTVTDLAELVGIDRGNLTKKIKTFENVEQMENKKWRVIADVRLDA